MSIIKEIWQDYSKWAYNEPFEAIWMTSFVIALVLSFCFVIKMLFYFLPTIMTGMSILLGVVSLIVWLAYRSHSKRHPE